MPSRSPTAGLMAFIAFTAIAAALGAWASADARTFYAALTQPPWAPPGSVFGPVWTVLYLSMAVAAWLVWRRHGWQGARWALSLYGVQLVANALWSWLFFGWRLGYWAFADVVLLWLLIAATVAAFFTRHRGAALLLLPYWAWVSFATALTWTVWRANPALLGT
ncbi:MAG: tryptophan-rich sensory protein [Hydrogenophaga sp.]|uniref:TspO/MBR family protein n=1 Tax=Hydrogenophaga sp. TaxID=1904254 RepID=UPI00257F32F0|nr:TspO/MBR family protein [Hydrogenophaga sp.]MBL0945141.1 tryptophan-rich sensory protein [Hydrogenophaga sp.]